MFSPCCERFGQFGTPRGHARPVASSLEIHSTLDWTAKRSDRAAPVGETARARTVETHHNFDGPELCTLVLLPPLTQVVTQQYNQPNQSY